MIRNSICQFVSRIGDDFCQGGVVMGNASEFLYCAAVIHYRDEFVDQFAAFGSDDVGAEDLTTIR